MTHEDSNLAHFSLLSSPEDIAAPCDRHADSPDARDERWRLRAELSRRAAEVEELRRDLSLELTLRNSRDEELARLAAAQEERVADQRERIVELEHALTLAQETLQDRQTQFESMNTQVTPLLTEIENRDRMIAGLRTKLRRMEKIPSDGPAGDNSIATLESSLAQKERDLRQARSENKGLCSALASTQHEVSASRAEVKELETTLSIARESIQARRDGVRQSERELAMLRESGTSFEAESEALCEQLRLSKEETSRQASEIEALRGTGRALDETIDARDREVAALGSRLALAQESTEKRGKELARMRERLHESSANCSRLQAELEEGRGLLSRQQEDSMRSQQELAGIRQALETVERAVRPHLSNTKPTPTASRMPEVAEATATGGTDAAAVRGTSAGEVPTSQASTTVAPPAAVQEPERALVDVQVIEPVAGSRPMPPIFRYWRDAQLARASSSQHDDAPRGCDDFFVTELARRATSLSGGLLRILSLRGEDEGLEQRLAARLRELGIEHFSIHPMQACDVAEREESGDASPATTRHIAEPVPIGAPAAWGRELRFDVALTSGALGPLLAQHDADSLAALLDAIARGIGPGGALLLAEQLCGISTHSDGIAMGERIWQLMPERYKHNHHRHDVDEHFSPTSEGLEAPRGSAPPLTPGEAPSPRLRSLLPLLQQRFDLAPTAAFGHLATHFVGPEIGPNFDPERQRDRRFIDQVASLDEGRIADGVLDPIYLVAIATPHA